ncbi:MAG TPA: DUF3037 domain-containing protein [Pyrinomonadaceae bacterium]|nr:DUF3037 domain-containing protein [Pyrinomonadaceae bacterium]
MSDRHSFNYAVVRVVPQAEREEFMNVGVILSCQAAGFLDAAFEVDERRLAAFAPGLDAGELRAHLEAIRLICEGGDAGGAIGRLPRGARFDWLVAPRSTIVRTSPVHTGLCSDPREALSQLLRKMVSAPPGNA